MAQLKIFDSCADTSTTTGTGTLTVLGVAPTGYQTPTAAGMANNDNIVIRIESASGTDWEVCESIYNSATPSFSRGTVKASSNSGSAVNFSAGTKNIKIVAAKELLAIGALTTSGDTLYHDGTKLQRLGIGSNGQINRIVGGLPSWVDIAAASYAATPSDPSAISTTTSFKMVGLAGSITPQSSGKVVFWIIGSLVSAGGPYFELKIHYGTGSAPTNGAAATGTAIGNIGGNNDSNSGDIAQFYCLGMATGLTAGTAYWIDLGIKVDAGTPTATLTAISIVAFEIGFSSSNYPISETPSGTINESNTAFTLSKTPAAANAIIVFVDNIPDSGATFIGTALTTSTAPANSIYCSYTPL